MEFHYLMLEFSDTFWESHHCKRLKQLSIKCIASVGRGLRV